MCPLVAPEVDALDSDADAGEQRLHQLVLASDQREHRPVVIRVGVDVQQPRVSAECSPDRVDRARVAALAEVGNRLERQHEPYSRAG